MNGIKIPYAPLGIMTVLLEYTDHLVTISKSACIVFHISYYAGIMLNAFSDPL